MRNSGLPTGEKVWRGRRGAGTLGVLFILILITSVIYAMALFVPPYYKSWKIDTILHTVCVNSESTESTEDIRAYAVSALAKEDIAVRPGALKISHDGLVTRIVLDYTETVCIPFTETEFVFVFPKDVSNSRASHEASPNP